MRLLLMLSVILSSANVFAAGPSHPKPDPSASPSPAPAKQHCRLLDDRTGFGLCGTDDYVCFYMRGSNLNCFLRQPGSAPTPAPSASDVPGMKK